MNKRQALHAICAGVCVIALPNFAIGADVDMHALVGKPAPQFVVTDSQGRKRQLSEFKGKAVVLEWTSPSCPFVKAQYQSGVMQEIQKAATAQGIVWLTILSTHPTRSDYLVADKAEAFDRGRNGAPTALLLDADGIMGRTYGAIVTPQMYVIDTAGTVVYSGATSDKATTDAKQARASKNFIKAALNDLAAGRKIATATSRPFGCTIAYSGR